MESVTDGEAIDQTDRDVEQKPPVHIPIWSGYQSKVNPIMSSTRIGASPLTAAPAHEWATLLTIIKQAQDINATVMATTRKKKKNVSLDMGMYKPAKQLQIARKDLDNMILRPGELHMHMAQIRSIGAYVESSGIDLCWTEGDLYGSTTMKQFPDENQVTRPQTTHTWLLCKLS